MFIEKKYKLKCKIAQLWLSSEQVAESIDMNKATFYKRLNNWSWTIEEVRKLVDVLQLSNEEVMDIFFNLKVS